jgi:hypothetical protein
MPIAYNIEPQNLTLIFKAGDTINQSFRMLLNDGSNPLYPKGDPYYYYDATGKRIDIKFRRKDGLLVKTLTSAGISPTVTIVLSVYNMKDTGFLVPDALDYDVQITDGTDIFTIQEGEAFVKKQIT